MSGVDFKTGKFVASKTGMVFAHSRRPKLIQPGCFEGPAAAWAPRREVGRAQRIQLRLPDLKRLHRLLAGDRPGYELHHRVADMRDTQSV